MSIARLASRLERLESAVRPTNCCLACFRAPREITFIRFDCCGSDGTWPLMEPSKPPYAASGRRRTSQMRFKIRPEGKPWPHQLGATEPGTPRRHMSSAMRWRACDADGTEGHGRALLASCERRVFPCVGG